VAVVRLRQRGSGLLPAHYDIAADPSAFDALRRPRTRSPLDERDYKAKQAAGGDDQALCGALAVRAASSTLATDIRFASRERAVLGQFEVGSPPCPGARPIDRLPGIAVAGHVRDCRWRGLTGNSTSGTGTSTAPFPTRSSSGSSMHSGAGRQFRLLAPRRYQALVKRGVAARDDANDRRDGAFAEAVARPTTPPSSKKPRGGGVRAGLPAAQRRRVN